MVFEKWTLLPHFLFLIPGTLSWSCWIYHVFVRRLDERLIPWHVQLSNERPPLPLAWGTQRRIRNSFLLLSQLQGKTSVISILDALVVHTTFLGSGFTPLASKFQLLSSRIPFCFFFIFVLKIKNKKNLAGRKRGGQMLFYRGTFGCYWRCRRCRCLGIVSFLPLPIFPRRHPSLCRSMLFFLASILSFVWRTGSEDDPSSHAPLSATAVLGRRVAITGVLVLGLVYLTMILKTLMRYGRGWGGMRPGAGANGCRDGDEGGCCFCAGRGDSGAGRGGGGVDAETRRRVHGGGGIVWMGMLERRFKRKRRPFR